METIKTIWHLIKIGLFILAVFACYKACKSFQENGYHFDKSSRSSYIYSLKTSSETNGSFILGIGSISGEDYYVFYRKTIVGGLIREKIKTSDCVLYEGYDTPKITEYGENSYHLVDGDTIGTTFSRSDYGSYLHEIYIPKGTITERVDNININ